MRARPDITHYMGPKKEATGQVHDAEMFHLASSGRVQGAVAKRHPVSTAWLATLRQLASLDLIIDVSRGRDHLFGGGGFSTERVPRAAAVVRSVASMTMNECLQARKRPWSCSNSVYTGVRNAFS